VASGTVLLCTKGGARQCVDHQWRVVCGQCTNEVVYDPNGNPENIITVSKP
jgi:hypothetical protein